jgi:DNA polymerase IV
LALDEAYLDVTENRRGLPTASATAKEIRARILKYIGLTASAGISYNKFLAPLPVAKFHGVGPVTAARMQRLGIQTGADLRAKSLAFLQQHFGKSAAWYLGIANGEDDRPVVADRPREFELDECRSGPGAAGCLPVDGERCLDGPCAR